MAIEKYAYNPDQIVTVLYRNWEGVESVRRIVPLGKVCFESTEHHRKVQWLISAYDVDKQAERKFALNDILKWGV